jgi:hypothetical protein
MGLQEQGSWIQEQGSWTQTYNARSVSWNSFKVNILLLVYSKCNESKLILLTN